MISESDRMELAKLIQTEIDLGFTFLASFDLSSNSGHHEHAITARQNAQVAWQTATKFLGRLTEGEALAFRSDLRDLEAAILARTARVT